MDCTPASSLPIFPIIALLCILALAAPALGADIPCAFDELGIVEIGDFSSNLAEEGALAGLPTMQGPGSSGSGPFESPEVSLPEEDVSTKKAKIRAAVDPTNPITRNKAVEIASQFSGSYNVQQLCSIYHFVKENWRNISDPRGTDFFSPASETITLAESIAKRDNATVAGAGDCDDFAILMASLIEAIGGTTRIVMAYDEKGGHAYAEVYVGQSDKDRTTAILSWLKSSYRCPMVYGHNNKDDRGFWLNLDWNADHPGGPIYQSPGYAIVEIGDPAKKRGVSLPPNYRIAQAFGSIQGVVSDGNGNPLACTVLVKGTDDSHSFSVNASGEFGLEVAPGSYQVTAEKPGYSFRAIEVQVLQGVIVSADLRGAVDREPNIQIITEAVDPVKRCVYYTRDNEGHQVFKIRVYVTGPEISRVKSVKYSLHETFEHPEHVSTDPASGFEMIIWSWGRFVMPITVTTTDGNEYLFMYPFTFRAQLEDAQRRGVRFIDATGAWDVIGGY
ncbi:MAG: carboxypeptidase regulatory-like domain-containing protein [Methanotrichaceae archaeon]|nr:carboxypeptidase regulatory-like domain-containing protein [Methanotrichaceae archaeon]